MVLVPRLVSEPVFFIFMSVLPVLAFDRLDAPLPRVLELSMVGLVVFIYGIAKQYFLLPIAMGSIFLDIPYIVFSLATTLIWISSPVSTGFELVPHSFAGIRFWSWNLVWIAGVVWLIWGVSRHFRRAYLDSASMIIRCQSRLAKAGSPDCKEGQK